MSLRLGIVIVHYNTPGDLGRCLESLRAEAPDCPHEIVVIDNASTAPGLDELAERFGEVRWLRNTENVGYGRGCNQGLAALSADYHLILNPDIVVLPGALNALLAYADAQPRAGLVGPQLLNEDGSVQESCRRFYTFRTLLLRRTILGKLFPRSETVRRHLMRDFDHASARPVDWVLGGCLLVRRQARHRCGPMDERFFLYFEDVDWCYRMWQCGFEVHYFPGARFVHRHRRASARGRFDRAFWLHLGSMLAFYEKWSLIVYAAKKWRRPLSVALYWLLDMVLLAVALLGAYGLRRLAQPLFAEDLLPLAWYRVWFAYAAVLVTVTFVLMGRYRTSHLRSGPSLAAHLKQMGLVALLLLSGSYLGREEVVSRAVLLTLLGLYTGLAIWATGVIGRWNRRLEEGFFTLERTLLSGPAAAVAGWLEASGTLNRDGIDLVGYVTDDQPPAAGHPALGEGRVPWLGSSAALPQLVERFRVSQVVFWQRPQRQPAQAAVLARLRRLRIRLRWVLEEAWLLQTGARPEPFGAAGSGVIDPDDGGALRRLALRPLELLVALPLVAVAGLLAPLRGRRLRSGAIKSLPVEVPAGDGRSGTRTLFADAAGDPLPIWWQSSLLLALWSGRVALRGAPLAVLDPAGGPPAAAAADRRPGWQVVLAERRPGLTAARPDGSPRAAGSCFAPLRDFFLCPGGPPSAAGPTVRDAAPDRDRKADPT